MATPAFNTYLQMQPIPPISELLPLKKMTTSTDREPFVPYDTCYTYGVGQQMIAPVNGKNAARKSDEHYTKSDDEHASSDQQPIYYSLTTVLTQGTGSGAPPQPEELQQLEDQRRKDDHFASYFVTSSSYGPSSSPTTDNNSTTPNNLTISLSHDSSVDISDMQLHYQSEQSRHDIGQQQEQCLHPRDSQRDCEFKHLVPPPPLSNMHAQPLLHHFGTVEVPKKPRNGGTTDKPQAAKKPKKCKAKRPSAKAAAVQRNNNSNRCGGRPKKTRDNQMSPNTSVCVTQSNVIIHMVALNLVNPVRPGPSTCVKNDGRFYCCCYCCSLLDYWAWYQRRRRMPTPAQRLAANVRERRRMNNLNYSFDILRARVPMFAYEKSLSRIETLKLGIMYIEFMNELLCAPIEQVMQKYGNAAEEIKKKWSTDV